jgi:four helix bundle protein
MKGWDIADRTKRLAIQAILFCDELPNKQKYWIIGKQLIRSAASVGANYRACQRAQSKPDFIHKLSIVEEEADECLYWFDLIVCLEPHRKDRISAMKKEAEEILSIVIASKKTAKKLRTTNVE